MSATGVGVSHLCGYLEEPAVNLVAPWVTPQLFELPVKALQPVEVL
jgi:hypothetical protein